MEQPVLRLGLIGFTGADIQRVQQAIATPVEGWPRWELVEFEQADAWCINGRGVEKGAGNSVTVHTLLKHLPTIRLDPSEITRPVAFTKPMPDGMEATETVNIKDNVALRVSLQRFEAWLRPLRAQFALGAEMVAREGELTQAVYHVIDTHGKLLAIVDFHKWRVGLLPVARPVDFEDAGWIHRPSSAADIPNNFIQLTVVQMMWTYAVRTTEDVLPLRYGKQMMYLRRVPNLPNGWLRDEHLVVLRALSAAPAKIDKLQSFTQLPEALLRRTLAALYFAGAITTNRASAGQVDQYKRSPVGEQSNLSAEPHSQPHSLSPHSIPPSRTLLGFRNHPYPPATVDITAPAPLHVAHW